MGPLPRGDRTQHLTAARKLATAMAPTGTQASLQPLRLESLHLREPVGPWGGTATEDAGVTEKDTNNSK